MRLPSVVRIYSGCVTLIGLPMAGWLVYQSLQTTVAQGWLTVAGLMVALIIADKISVPVSRDGRNNNIVHVTAPFAVALVVLGPLSACLVALALAALIDIVRSRFPIHIGLFNIAQGAIAVAAARGTFALISGETFFGGSALNAGLLPAILAAGMVYMAVNAVLVDIAYALALGKAIPAQISLSNRRTACAQAMELALLPFVILAADFSVLLLPVLMVPVAVAVRATRLAANNERDALHDPLTGLPNRALLEERFADMTRDGVAAPAQRLAVLAVGVDQFHDITETLGHDAGDQLLREVGERLRAVARGIDVVGRLSGDVFAVLAVLNRPEQEEALELELLSQRLLTSLGEPFELDGVRVDIQATAGGAMYPAHGATAQVLLPRAESALHTATDGRRGILHVHDPAKEVSSPLQLSLLGELRHAVTSGEIEVFYQPKVASISGVVSGVEALVRWRHPERGLIPPMEFIPLAETTGLIAPLTWEVLDQSLRQVRSWLERGWDIGVSVNLAAAQLMDSETPAHIVAALSEHGVPARLLTVEVTESTLIQDAEKAIGILAQLRQVGIKISVDDYGTGYSSLAYLQRLSVDELKIDRTFIKNLSDEDNTHDLAIVETTITLGHRLFLSVVAEGVEREEELEILRNAGCDLIQGYFYSPPKPGAEITKWLEGREVPPALSRYELPTTAAERAASEVCGACGQKLRGHRGTLCVERNPSPGPVQGPVQVTGFPQQRDAARTEALRRDAGTA